MSSALALYLLATAAHATEPVEVEVEAALGAQWVPLVGGEAALVRQDWIQLPGARLAQSVLALEVAGPLHTHAELRIEEGVFHAGGLEAAEAILGWAEPTGHGGLWVGRGDLPVTPDRRIEAEDHALSVRPVVSRAALPLHAGGVGADVAWPERASLAGGLAYASATTDAPYRWARAELTPLGPPTSRQDLPEDGLTLHLGGAVLSRVSDTVSDVWLTSADGALRWGPLLLGGGWVRARIDGSTSQELEEVLAELGLRGPSWSWGSLGLFTRGERATGLEAGEEARLLGTARLSWLDPDARLTVYVEGTLSREQAAPASEGVVDLGRGIERPNDTLALGGLLRW